MQKKNGVFTRSLTLQGLLFLAALTLFCILSSCHIYNLSLEDFLKEWTETARIAESSISPEPVYKDSYAHIASGEDVLITYYLVNPQSYELNGIIAWSGEVSAEQVADYILEQDAADRSLFYLTLKDGFLEGLDGDGTEISPTLTITEPNSGRTFGSYTVPALVNSPPPAVILPVVLRTCGGAEDETYVICFNLPDMTGIHGDVTTLKIGSPYEKTYTVNTNGTLSGGGTELTTTYDTGWKPVTDAQFIGDKDNRFVGIVTDVPLSDNLTTFTLTLTDRSGLSTSVTASTQAPKLDSVTANPKGGAIEIGDTVTFTGPVSEADIVLASDSWTGVEKNDIPVSGEIKGTGSITLTFTTAGTYNITAYATLSGAADSDKVTFTYDVQPLSTTINIPGFGEVKISATVNNGKNTVTITGVPAGAEIASVSIHGKDLEEQSGSPGTYTIPEGTPQGTYPLTVVVKYGEFSYSGVIDITV